MKFETRCIHYLGDPCGGQDRDYGLKSKCNHTSSTKEVDGNTAPRKKSVSFADSIGLELVKIRHMTAGRDTPPVLGPEVFASLNIDKSKKIQVPTLLLGFQQPVSDYSRFRECLDRNKVSLESASLNGNHIIGIVKVKNLAFNKRVVVHMTYDSWTTSEDIEAYYVNNSLVNAQGSPISSSMDTFSFTHDLSVHKLTRCGIQLAICFCCKGEEFWDNNDGKNYSINLDGTSVYEGNLSHVTKSSNYNHNAHQECNWTEFAIWRSLESDYTPYW